MLDDLLILFGRFHPLIIHLPIGFIILGILIEINKKNFKWSNDALTFIFFWATITGIFSIISGFLQYQNCLLYTSPSPRDRTRSRMPSSA